MSELDAYTIGRRARAVLLATAVTLLALCASGCGPQATTAAKPGLSASQAASAVAALRGDTNHTSTAGSSWISANPNGTFSARGYLMVDKERSPGFLLVVPEGPANSQLLHLVPLRVKSSTPFTGSGRRVVRDWGEDALDELPVVDATFTVTGGTLDAAGFSDTGTRHNWTDESGVPPTEDALSLTENSSADRALLESSALLPRGNGSAQAVGALKGRISSVSEESVDLLVPDNLDGALVWHLIRLRVPDKDVEARALLLMEGDKSVAVSVTASDSAWIATGIR